VACIAVPHKIHVGVLQQQQQQQQYEQVQMQKRSSKIAPRMQVSQVALPPQVLQEQVVDAVTRPATSVISNQ
jgi:hypothetical protein